MWYGIAVAVSAYRDHGLDVCPSVQENLNGPEVAFLRSKVEGSPSKLSETQRNNTYRDIWKVNNMHTIYT
jgi:hypothetical protein